MSELNMTRRRFAGLAAVGAATLGAGLAGCSSGSGASSSAAEEEQSASSASSAEEAASASSAEEPAAASSAPEETMEEEMARPVILVTSFGTSFPDSRHITIGAIESDIREAFPDYDVRRAFTAQIIIDHIEEDTGRHIDNFEEAMDRAIADGVKEIVIQPTHLMNGFEYNDIKESMEKDYAGKFEKMALGDPLLTSDADFKAVAEAIKGEMKKYEEDGTAICLMGHGTEADSNSVYEKMQGVFSDLGYDNYFVATVEAEPTFADVAEAASKAGFTKAVLRPLMVVAGDHANNDMADEEDSESFASIMKAAGFEVTSCIEGLGQIDEIDDLYVQHTQAAVASL